MSQVAEVNAGLPLRKELANLQCKEKNGVRWFDDGATINSQDRHEFEAYDAVEVRRSANEVNAELFEDLIFKSNFIYTFRNFIPMMELRGSERILEMGGGQGWASVLVKEAHPGCYVVGSDLVPNKVGYSEHYEKMLGVGLDEKWAFNSRVVPFDENQFDLIFTMAAFHHFGEEGDFTPALAEMVRVLKPGGRIRLFYEPSSPRYISDFQRKRANKRQDQDGVDEDLIIPKDLVAAAQSLGCSAQVSFFPYPHHRDNVKSALYYFALSKLSFLKTMLPCTVNVTIS
jgi:SAM-dependent methyltransferase